MIGLLFSLLTQRHDMQLVFGEREWYGGHCEQRAIGFEFDGRWYETAPRRCA